MPNPQTRPPTVRFANVSIAPNGIVVSTDNGLTTLVTLERLPQLEPVDSRHLQDFVLSADRFYIAWPAYGLRISYDDIVHATQGGDDWDRRPLESKLCEESLGLHRGGRTKEAIEVAHIALLIAMEGHVAEAIGRNAGNLGMFYADLGDQNAAARKYLNIALAHANGPAATELRANTLGNLGVILVDEGEPEEGIRLLQESLRMHEAARNYVGQSISHGEIGIARLGMGQPDQALDAFQRALAAAERANSDSLIQAWGPRVELLSRLTATAVTSLPDRRESRNIFQKISGFFGR